MPEAPLSLPTLPPPHFRVTVLRYRLHRQQRADWTVTETVRKDAFEEEKTKEKLWDLGE